MASPLKSVNNIRGYDVIINTLPDFSEAKIEIQSEENSNSSDFPTKDEMENLLKSEGIILGIKDDVLERISSRMVTDTEIVVASELPAKNGEDSKIKYILEDECESVLTQDEHGNIDFKELNWFKSVTEGDVLAKKIPFTMGIDGYNIKGEKIQGLPGRDVAFKFGANVEVTDNDLTLVATKSGRYENIDGKISVNDILEIRGDIDPSVGNIQFEGDVVVRKDIKAGYSVSCKGSLEVGGVVEAADIDVGGDLVVKGGIKGNDTTKINVGGSLVCKFIENANVKALGDITSDFIIHSLVKSGGSIKVDGKKSLISGGEVVARDKITVNTVGSHMATKTNIVLGIDLIKSEKLAKNLKEIEEIESELKKMSYKINVSKERMQRGQMDTIKKIEFTKLLRDYSKNKEKINKLDEEIEKLEEDLRVIKNSYIQVKDRIYPGIRVTIGENSKFFSDVENSCKVVLENSEITVKKE